MRASAVSRLTPAPNFRLDRLPPTLPVDGAVHIDVVDGVPVFRASPEVEGRIEALLSKMRAGSLSDAERAELDGYEALDDHLSLLNRLARNHQQD